MGTSLVCAAGEKGTLKPAGIAHLTHQPNFQYQYSSNHKRGVSGPQVGVTLLLEFVVKAAQMGNALGPQTEDLILNVNMPNSRWPRILEVHIDKTDKWK